MNRQERHHKSEDTPVKRRLRLAGAAAALVWPCISYRFHSEWWIVPASIVAFAVIIRCTRRGNVLPYAVRGLTVAFVLSVFFLLPTLNSNRHGYVILWTFGFWILGIYLGVLLGVAADLGDRPDNPFQRTDEEKGLARRDPQSPDDELDAAVR